MNRNYIIAENDRNGFNNAMELLDRSVGELQKVTQNIVPEVLINNGLKDALAVFCEAIDNTHGISVEFKLSGENRRIDNNTEIALYRAAFELVYNAVKHSGATEIKLGLAFTDDEVCLSAEDNGRGFDLNSLYTFNESGLNSLKKMVNSLNGIFDISSSRGKGSKVIVEFLVN
ncbi:MAG: hypothetical protein JXB34_03190 [Bacteroidales bacterium]|nr:hypothetical protein [Bacteroidales bacterium]